MRLFLSSYIYSDCPEKLFDLLGGAKPKVAIVTNAADLFPEAGILERFNDDKAFFEHYGYKVERLDLREYFGKQKELQAKVDDFGLFWVRGGNAFVLRRAMAQSGFDEIIIKKLKDDEVVYAGYSAGGCVLSPSLKGLELVDDTVNVPEGYEVETIWQGLGVLPYTFVPHYKSNHPESNMINETVNYLKRHNMPYRTVRDGQAIVISNDGEALG